MTIEIFFLVVVVLYVSQIATFLIGLRQIKDDRSNSEQPFVSVIIAARNEENNLGDSLQSVTNQSYPSGKYEVIVANDNSTDSTQQICDSYSQRYSSISSFLTVPDPKLPGKPNALAQAIDRANGTIILITDADCTVPATWIEETARRYHPRLGIMGGMTLQHATRHFEGMQSLDWAYLLGVATSTVALRNPLSTIGNNLSFRKEAYEAVGGYRSIPFSVTEDYTLFQAIIQTGKWDYHYPIDPGLLVMSKPCPNFRALLRQKHRWGNGGLDMKPSGFLVMAIGFLMHGFIAAALLLGNFWLASLAWLIKMSGDYAFLHRVLHLLDRKDLLKYFYSFQLYYSVYVLILPFVVFFGGKVVWKGRTY